MRFLVLPTLLALVLLADTLRGSAMDAYLEERSYEDVYVLPSAEWLSVFSAGHHEAVADLVWAKALVYVGDEFRHEGGLRNVFRYADAILTLDPDHRRAYRWVGTMGLYRPTGTTLEDGERTVGFLRQGVERFPNDGELVWDLAATLTYELPSFTDDLAEKERYRAEGSEFMMRAAELGAGPHWLVLTNATSLVELGRTEQAIRHLEEMYPLVDDEETRRDILFRIELLQGQADAEALRRIHADLEAAREESYPYIPMDLFLFVGERSDPDEALERWFLPGESQ
ncbi:MAG: hypothetical protein AAGE52_04820 [Myxococcota bacterium]